MAYFLNVYPVVIKIFNENPDKVKQCFLDNRDRMKKNIN